jgi:hypothetical protein
MKDNIKLDLKGNAGSYKHGNEPSRSMKDGDFLD